MVVLPAITCLLCTSGVRCPPAPISLVGIRLPGLGAAEGDSDLTEGSNLYRQPRPAVLREGEAGGNRDQSKGKSVKNNADATLLRGIGLALSKREAVKS